MLSDPDRRLPERGQDRDLARADARARRQHRGAGRDVLAGAADVLSGHSRAGEADPIAPVVGLLAHHHRVGAARQRAAGHDAKRGPRRQLLAGRGACGDGAGHRQVARQIGGAHREAVHRRVVEGRQGPRGGERGGEEAPERLRQRDLDGLERAYPLEDPSARLGHAQHGLALVTA